MHSLFYSLFLISVLASAYVSAANDWSVPCVSGSCSWDTGDGNTTAYSSMTLVRFSNMFMVTAKMHIHLSPRAGPII